MLGFLGFFFWFVSVLLTLRWGEGGAGRDWRVSMGSC